jgi:quercetin dioxygenase-like cupin family protein
MHILRYVMNWKYLTVAVSIVSALAAVTAALTVQGASPARSRVAIAQALPRLDGSRLEATLVEVSYDPGGANTPHRHPCPVIGYMLEGSMRMQVKGQPERIYKPGDTFFESPTDVHVVSANTSQNQPARFLAYFVCDQRTPLSVPVADGRGGGN